MPDYLELLRGLMAALGPREAEAKMRPMDDRASAMIKAQREAQAPAPGTPEADAPLTGRWFSPERRSVYQDIGRATEAYPQTVEVYAPQEWPKEQSGIGGFFFPTRDEIALAPMEYEYQKPIMMGQRVLSKELASNLPRGTAKDVVLPPADPGGLPAQDVLAHEQLHFLMAKLMQAEEAEARARRSGMGWFASRRDYQGGVGTGARKAYGHTDSQHALIAYLLGKHKVVPFIEQDSYPEPMTGTHPPASSPEIADAYRRLIYQIFPDETRRAKALAGLGASRGGTLLEELR